MPEECKNCMEDDCYNCDIAGKRWSLSGAEELRINRMHMARAIARLQRKIAAIDAELEKMREG